MCVCVYILFFKNVHGMERIIIEDVYYMNSGGEGCLLFKHYISSLGCEHKGSRCVNEKRLFLVQEPPGGDDSSRRLLLKKNSIFTSQY